ncbi:Sodium/calcium exchanger protein-domain-containing protein [Amylostereum chailletii]|nr:Sodium/calcium exchanger protein-domain-containing protein [Amylostereum chailletii]
MAGTREEPAWDTIVTDYYAHPRSRYYNKQDAGVAPDRDRLSLAMSRLDSRSSSTSASSTNLLRDNSASPPGYSPRPLHWPWKSSPPQEQLDPDPEHFSLPTHDHPKRSTKPWYGWQHIILGSWFNLLLVFIPASWIVYVLIENSHTLVFIFCIFALIPLARLHDLATSDLATRVGGSKAGLINASLSNLVEAVVAITALRKCQLRVVQASLIGTMLSKLLLVLGTCFFAGGLRFREQQGFDATASHIYSSLLSISVAAVLMPAAYHFALSGDSPNASAEQKIDILQMSHGVAIILLFLYAAYLLFQFYSHTHLFKDNEMSKRHSGKGHKVRKADSRRDLTGFASLDSEKVFRPRNRNASSNASPGKGLASTTSLPELPNGNRALSPYSSVSELSIPLSRTSSNSSTSTVEYTYGKGAATPAPALGSTVKLIHRGGSPMPAMELPATTLHPNPSMQFDEETMINGEDRLRAQGMAAAQRPPQPKLSWPLTMTLLVVVTVLIIINAERLVESMKDLSEADISREWIGLILLPTVSCIAECVTVANVSRKDQLTLSVSVAVGSTIQTALFVTPLMVILGWILGKPLPLLFDPFESVVLFLSVHTMGYVVADGKSNWLEGTLLICLYIIIAVAFWFYPGSSFSSTLASCASDIISDVI